MECAVASVSFLWAWCRLLWTTGSCTCLFWWAIDHASWLQTFLLSLGISQLLQFIEELQLVHSLWVGGYATRGGGHHIDKLWLGRGRREGERRVKGRRGEREEGGESDRPRGVREGRERERWVLLVIVRNLHVCYSMHTIYLVTVSVPSTGSGCSPSWHLFPQNIS